MTKAPIALLAATAMLGACAAAPPPAALPSGPEKELGGAPERIAFTAMSWGRQTSGWTIDADGSGTWTKGIGQGRSNTALERHAFSAGAGGFARVLALVIDPAPDFADCKPNISDQPYGELSLSRGAKTVEVRYQTGCTDAAIKAYLAKLEAANALVTDWGKAAPVSATEVVTP